VSVYRQKDRKAYTYEFQYRGKTYKGSTGQLTKEDAEAFERREQERVRRQAAGLTDLRDAPPFQEWAGVYYQHKAHSRQKVKRPDQIDFLIRTVLKFWGRRPTDPAKVAPDAPYHDLTLAEPILEPEWLERFESWMEAQRFSGSHRNHLRTQISGMYKVAALPQYRKVTGILASMNPMAGVPRDRRVVRDVSVTPEQVQAWITQASYHIRLALAIAALAPKLRMSNILALEWAVHLDKGLTRITVADHKTDARTGRPLVVMIGAQLRDILEDARRRNPGRWVVSYRGRRVRWIREGVRRAAIRADIPYGRAMAEGATFHTIRHAVATWLAEDEELTEPQRAALLAHTDIKTTQGYTHLRPVRELKPLERLSAKLAIADLVKQPWRRWSKTRGKTGGPGTATRGKP
jgi:integrase